LVVPGDKSSFSDFEELSSLFGFEELVVVIRHSIDECLVRLFINGDLVFKPQLMENILQLFV